jgi:hypothetical protein
MGGPLHGAASTLQRVLLLCGGFLLAVLWMDLMFDLQVWAQPAGPLPETVLASIAAYYRRVTTDAHPMGQLVGAVMVATLVGVAWQLARGAAPLWTRAAAAGCAVVPIALALLRVFPHAVRLGQRADPIELQSALARSIFAEHVACLVLISAFVILELSGARRS